MEIEALEEGRQTSRQESILKAYRQNAAKVQEQRQQSKQQQAAKTEQQQRPEQQQGEVAAADLAAVLVEALNISPKKKSASQSQAQRARQANRNAQFGQLKMKQGENLNKAGRNESSVSQSTRLLSARKSGTVVALQGLMAPKETSKAAGKKTETEEFDVESPELSDEALSIIDRNKTRAANSARMRERTTGPQQQSFLNQNQGATVKRFVNPGN